MIYVLACLLGLLCVAGIIYVVWTWPAPRSPENGTRPLRRGAVPGRGPVPLRAPASAHGTTWRVLKWTLVYRPGWPPFDQDAPTAEDYWREHTGRQA